MTRRRISWALWPCLLVASFPLLGPGCNPDDGQPPRGSIVPPPRENGGPRPGIDEKVKPKARTPKSGA